jgi:hypothetical protein
MYNRNDYFIRIVFLALVGILYLGVMPAQDVYADSCSVMRGSTSSTPSNTRYDVPASCFTDAGWHVPVSTNSGNVLTTSTNYDYSSYWYNQNHGFWHGGVDWVGSYSAPYNTDTPVYAIDGGVVRYIVRETSTTLNELNDSRLHIKHTAANGTEFLAIYAHTYASSGLAVGSNVTKGQNIGTLRQYNTPIHLHFELNTDLNTTSYGGVKTGTVDPMMFLINNPALSSPSNVTIANQASTPQIKPGEILLVYYFIRNYTGSPIQNVRLGARIRQSNPQGSWIDDSINDVVITIPPTSEPIKVPEPYYQRTFRIPDTINTGQYDLIWVILKHNTGEWLDSKEQINAFEIIPSGQRKRADLNGDDRVDMVDVAIMLHYWGSTAKPVADINQDGRVNAQDASIMMSNWYNP